MDLFTNKVFNPLIALTIFADMGDVFRLFGHENTSNKDKREIDGDCMNNEPNQNAKTRVREIRRTLQGQSGLAKKSMMHRSSPRWVKIIWQKVCGGRKAERRERVAEQTTGTTVFYKWNSRRTNSGGDVSSGGQNIGMHVLDQRQNI